MYSSDNDNLNEEPTVLDFRVAAWDLDAAFDIAVYAAIRALLGTDWMPVAIVAESYVLSDT